MWRLINNDRPPAPHEADEREIQWMGPPPPPYTSTQHMPRRLPPLRLPLPRRMTIGARDAYASRAMGMFLTLYLLYLRPFLRCHWIISINYDTQLPRLACKHDVEVVLCFFFCRIWNGFCHPQASWHVTTIIASARRRATTVPPYDRSPSLEGYLLLSFISDRDTEVFLFIVLVNLNGIYIFFNIISYKMSCKFFATYWTGLVTLAAAVHGLLPNLGASLHRSVTWTENPCIECSNTRICHRSTNFQIYAVPGIKSYVKIRLPFTTNLKFR